MHVFVDKLTSMWDYLVIRGGILLSFLITLFLSAIGYPKQVIVFVVVLMIADVVSRWVAEVVMAYDYFDLINFFKAWRYKVLNSKKLKSGLYVKIFYYAIILFIAHQASITEELAFGQLISNFLYSILIVLDCISIMENATESHFEKAVPILCYMKRIKNKVFNTFLGEDYGSGDNSNNKDKKPQG